jgi:hypothetical protein
VEKRSGDILLSDTPCGDPPPDPPHEQSAGERAPRTNLLLAATIEAGQLQAAVRIRNLSESGALLEGAAFPNIGAKLTLRRMDLEIGATVVWRTAARCGVKFDGQAVVAEWVSGRIGAPASTRAQARVDNIQAAVRAGLAPAAPRARSTMSSEELQHCLDSRIAEELAHVRRLLEKMGEELSNEPVMVQRHSKTLQGFDLACQTLGHLAAILAAEDRDAALEAVGMDDLRARLLRKTLFKKH